jgi:copper homeostasis protein
MGDGRVEPEATLLLEACVDSVESAIAAEAGGAGRVELCDNLVEGGTTPSAGAIAMCVERIAIPVFVMIRPRGGDFLYSDVEFDVMRRDISLAKGLGAHGVVFGILNSDGTVDVERSRVLVEEARPLEVTFHRAFDVTRDAAEALEALIGLGIERVLSSGQVPTAGEGAETLASLVQQARGRIGILPGGGVDKNDIGRIVRETGVTEVHVRGTSLQPSGMAYRNPGIDFGGRISAGGDTREVTDPDRIRQILESAS